MRRGARTRYAALLLLACGCLLAVRPARAADDVRTELREVLAESGEEAAETFLGGILAGYAAGGDSDRALDAADAALAVLPGDLGRAHAAEFLATVLERERGQPRAWRAAFRLRDEMQEALDTATGEHFLVRLIEVYPEQDAFRLSLARLYKGAGRPVEAYGVLEEVVRRGGGGTIEALYELAVLDELGGDAERALTRYDEILRMDAGQTGARCSRAAVLRHTLRRYERAAEALDDVREAVGRLAAGPERDQLRAWLEGEDDALRRARDERSALSAADAHIRRALYGALLGWLLLLAGGGLLLRRRGLL